MGFQNMVQTLKTLGRILTYDHLDGTAYRHLCTISISRYKWAYIYALIRMSVRVDNRGHVEHVTCTENKRKKKEGRGWGYTRIKISVVLTHAPPCT